MDISNKLIYDLIKEVGYDKNNYDPVKHILKTAKGELRGTKKIFNYLNYRKGKQQ